MTFHEIYSAKHAAGSAIGTHTPVSSVIADNQRIHLRSIGRKLVIRTLANFLLFYSIYMIGWVFLEPLKAEIRYAYNNAVGIEYVVSDSTDTNSAPSDTVQDPSFEATQGSEQKGLLAQVLGAQTVQALSPQDPSFSILIPKLGANSRIIRNVDSSDEPGYLAALKSGVAHAAGTAFPGQGRHIYLFAHSTNTFANVSRYNAIFYLLYKLEQGDEVNLYFDGVRYKYIVTGKEIVSPYDVQYLTRATDSEMLTMQTCWPPGTVAERLLIFAKPVGALAEVR